MQINYAELIREDIDELSALERRLRGTDQRSRVQMLRLLKSGNVRSLRAAAPILGYSLRQLNRWWELYQRAGLTSLVQPKSRPGRQSQLTPEAAAALRAEIAAGRIIQLSDARRYLSERWDIHYDSLNGIWWMLRRDGIRLRGLRRERKAAEG